MPDLKDQALLEKIRSLPPDKHAEVEQFVERLVEREGTSGLAHHVTRLSEDVFRKVWDNPDDADYDRL